MMVTESIGKVIKRELVRAILVRMQSMGTKGMMATLQN